MLVCYFLLHSFYYFNILILRFIVQNVLWLMNRKCVNIWLCKFEHCPSPLVPYKFSANLSLPSFQCWKVLPSLNFAYRNVLFLLTFTTRLCSFVLANTMMLQMIFFSSHDVRFTKFTISKLTSLMINKLSILEGKSSSCLTLWKLHLSEINSIIYNIL